ncbi:MAG: orotidine-5'-phosphate decarboxylase [Lachnospiraceae bacterium]|nr:orotidine-5'-phosphate decarboxylase [Lachnospiraceae bacterium]
MISKLIEKIREKEAPIVVGLDPSIANIPRHIIKNATDEKGETLAAAADAIISYNKAIVDKVYDLVPAVKPQIAMYEQFGVEGMRAFTETVNYCKEKGLIVIGDIKRGDIGSTSLAYAQAHIGKVSFGSASLSAFDEDFCTVNPYLGADGVKPFIEECNKNDRGIFVLVKTSNPSSGDFQDRVLRDEDSTLYETVGIKVNEWAALSMDGAYSNVGAVAGATYPKMGEILRRIMPRSYILVPGYGAQGGTGKDLVPFFNPDGLGAIVNSSRGIIAAYKKDEYKHFGEEGFADAARAAVLDMKKDINDNVFAKRRRV